MFLVEKVVADHFCRNRVEAWIVSWIGKLQHGIAEQRKRNADPLRARVQAIMDGKQSIGTAPLLDLLSLPKTTGNARRVGQTMRSLGFVPLKSRRLEPGGYRDTVTRGWIRPLRQSPRPCEENGLGKVATSGG
jgi:hypothetical protein